MATADRFILDRLTVREAQLYQQADAIDVKGSILLVAVIFFASQTVTFLHDTPNGPMHWEQVIAGASEVLAATLIAWLLVIRKKYTQEAAEDYPKWRDKLETVRDSRLVEDGMISEIINDLAGYCEDAYKLNNHKAKLLAWSYWVVIAVMLLNILFSGLRVLGVTS